MANTAELKDLLIVVPYRNRAEHLEGFLQNSPLYFDQQGLTYDILICELDQQGDWNAGLCANSLTEFITQERQYKWLYVHHVDVWPTSGKWSFPEDENKVYFNLGDYGSCLLSLKAFLDVGGYSNSFWGWGAEDNELYTKLKHKGYNVIDGSVHFPVKYNTTFQGHERKFNGKNYANGIKQLLITPHELRNNINDFSEHGEVKDLQNIEKNIYKQTVIPLKKSADQAINNKVLLGYIKGVDSFDALVSYVKSAGMYSAYEFDMTIFVADEKLPTQVTDQLTAFGVKWIHRVPVYKDLFIDRHLAYKEFLENNPQYIFALHTDVTDVFFQNNPFKDLPLDKLTITDEGIKLEDESWNISMFKGVYGEQRFNECKETNVLCGGIIGAPSALFIEFCEKIIKEWEALGPTSLRGVDQPIIIKLLRIDKTFETVLNIVSPTSDFCINLHVPVHYSEKFPWVKIEKNKVCNSLTGNKYSIVHQHNRIPQLLETVRQHYIRYYYPIF